MIKGIGVDTIELHRIERIYAEYGERFLNRIYADEERRYALRYKDPIPRLAARFAAKEACMKALGTGWNQGVRWRDIVVTNAPSGQPTLTLHGKARDYADRLSVDVIHITITHDREHAMVMVILE
jgi:holo-[acyl-carrier protein] synthase